MATTTAPLHVRDDPAADEEERRLRTAVSVRLSGSDPAAKRAEILEYFRRTWALTERLFEPLTEKAHYQRADPLRHPLVFYWGHVACFFVNKLRLQGLVTERVNPHFESLFAIGVDEMSWDDLLSDDFEWPPLAKVTEYRATVKAIVERVIAEAPLTLPIKWEDPMYVILMGIEHERIHLETSSVLIRFLPLEALRGPGKFWRPYRGGGAARGPDEVPANGLLQVSDKPAEVRLGVDARWDQYVWDNEFGEQRSVVPPFKASRFLVTNAEFLRFVQDGGYQTRALWTDEGWRFAQFRAQKGALHPPFWRPTADGTTFRLRLMLEEVDMPWDWPAEVNQLEAKAYCNWLKAREGRPIRLPTEDEYALLRRREVPRDYLEWGERAPANISLEYAASSTPVDAFPASPGGFYDVIGNVWQHTETPIDALPGFRVHKVYDDFSVPTFDLQHNMIKGGSWISTGNEANQASRYAFRRHFYQHAGFRYVETAREVELRSQAYERDEVVHQYVDNHYGPELPFGVPNFAAAIAALAAGHARRLGVPMGRALDMGCATGRGVFELAREGFDSVLGLDFSARFIRKAVELQETAVVKYTRAEEGLLTSHHQRTLVELGLDDYRDRVSFFQADACNLDPRYTGYDVVVAANLIDRLYDPTLFLSMVHERVNEGGLLVVASPYTWSVEHTPCEAWLGGYVNEAGKEVSSLDGLRLVLEERFEMVAEPADVPFVLRDTPRAFQHTLSQVTVWRRK